MTMRVDKKYLIEAGPYDADKKYLISEIYAKQFYDGLFHIDGEIYARTGCYYKGKRITGTNKLYGAADMVLAALYMGEDLNKETEIRPLVDLVFANAARECGLTCGLKLWFGLNKRRLVYIGLRKIEAKKLIPEGSRQIIKNFLYRHKDLWPKDVQPLLPTYHRFAIKDHFPRHVT